jgi:hypothetical protein
MMFGAVFVRQEVEVYPVRRLAEGAVEFAAISHYDYLSAGQNEKP